MDVSSIPWQQYGTIGLVLAVLVWFLKGFLEQHKAGNADIVQAIREGNKEHSSEVASIERSHQEQNNALLTRLDKLTDHILGQGKDSK